jgi:hypothetical protein
VGDTLDDLRNLLGGDFDRLRERWQIDVVRDDSAGVELEAAARDGTRAPVRRLRLTFAGDLIRPKAVHLLEGDRDETHIDFGPLIVDSPVADAEMLPPGGS